MNYEQLLAALRARARTEQRDGYEWIVKPIPYSSITGLPPNTPIPRG